MIILVMMIEFMIIIIIVMIMMVMISIILMIVVAIIINHIYENRNMTVIIMTKKSLSLILGLHSFFRSRNSLCRLKFTAQRDLTSERTQNMLEMMAEPHRWQLAG